MTQQFKPEDVEICAKCGRQDGCEAHYEAGRSSRDAEVQALLQSAQRYREALVKIRKTSEMSRDEGGLLDDIWATSGEALSAPSKACESGEGGGGVCGS